MPGRGCVFWLTGLPCSGKTTLGRGLASESNLLMPVELLDGDEIRAKLSPDLGYSRKDRQIHLQRTAFLAKKLASHGVFVVVAAVSPYAVVRDAARREISAAGIDFFEIYLQCSLKAAEARDVKGMYVKARRGEIDLFTGISDPYEIPSRPDLTIDTENLTPESSLARLLDFAARVRPAVENFRGFDPLRG